MHENGPSLDLIQPWVMLTGPDLSPFSQGRLMIVDV